MTNTQHTPAPWEYIGDGFDSNAALACGTDGYSIITKTGDDSLGEQICELSYNSDDDQAESNARLIAAAPELLAALEDLLSTACHLSESVYHERGTDEYEEEEEITKARVAIAKARGK